MKIAIDFDDVMVDTMREFERLYNSDARGGEALCVYENITDWGLPRQLGCSDSRVKILFERIDYDNVEAVPGAVEAVLRLELDHEISFLTSNQRTAAIRDKLNDLGFRHIPVFTATNKAGWLRDNRYDILVDDRPSYLKGADTVGVIPIRFVRPWNDSMTGSHMYAAQTWAEVLEHVNFIVALKQFKGDLDAMFGYKSDYHYGDEIVVNKNGAKQSKINGRFDLLPVDAITEVAKVFETGADRYGVDNWKGLSIDEVNNHVFNHLFQYQKEPNLDDLSHAACRILMALQLHIDELEKRMEGIRA